MGLENSCVLLDFSRYSLKAMRNLITIFLLLLLNACNDGKPNPTSNSNLSPLERAHQEKDQFLAQLLKEKGIDSNHLNLFIRAFKKEKILEVWAKNDTDSQFAKLITYPFCQLSGLLGPKRKQGDSQVPEGVYYINRFNPRSSYYLSLGLDYPNKSDAIRGVKGQLGGDIYIHGDCVTIGCIPITDDKIKELYLLAEMAKINGQVAIPVHIFPTKLTNENIKKISQQTPSHQAFWQELKSIYDAFEQSKKVPLVDITAKGVYLVNN